jgi:hypothetical protein
LGEAVTHGGYRAWFGAVFSKCGIGDLGERPEGVGESSRFR